MIINQWGRSYKHGRKILDKYMTHCGSCHQLDPPRQPTSVTKGIKTNEGNHKNMGSMCMILWSMHRRDYQQTDSIYDQTLVCILLQAWAHSQLIVSMHKHKHIYDSKKNRLKWWCSYRYTNKFYACQMGFLYMNIERNSTLTQMGFYKCNRNPCEHRSQRLRGLYSISQEA